MSYLLQKHEVLYDQNQQLYMLSSFRKDGQKPCSRKDSSKME